MTRARNIAGFSTITTTPSPVHVGPIGVLTATRIDGEFNQVDLATRNITAAGIAATNLQVSGITTGLNVSGIITAQNGINFNGTSTGLNVSGVGTIATLNVSGNATVGGVLTYEDVTRVDSVGVVTARGLSIFGNTTGLQVASGISTFQAVTGTTGTFSAAVSGTTGTFTGIVKSGTTATGNIFSVGDGGASGDRVIQFKRAARSNDINIQAINSGTGATNLLFNQEGGAASFGGAVSATTGTFSSTISQTAPGSSTAKLTLNNAIQNSNNSKSLFFYTSKINKNYSEEKKLLLIETLWEIVLSDGKLHDYETSLIRRLAGLLYISDVNSGNARKKALDKIRTSR